MTRIIIFSIFRNNYKIFRNVKKTCDVITSTINFFFDVEYRWMFDASPFKYGLFITCVSFRAAWCRNLTVVPCTVSFLFSHLVNKLVTLNHKLLR